jgi:L-lactate dehydrogenase
MDMTAGKELKPEVSIIGGGNVGLRYAYALMISGAARRICLVDLNREKLEGEVMDLNHGAPYISPVEVSAVDYPEIAGSDLVVVTAGKGQKPGQSRLDLIRDNVELYKTIIPTVVEHAPEALLLIVTNPVDVLSYAAYKISQKPAGRVIGAGTVLDSARLRFLVGRHCRVDPRSVHAYILGEHGDSEFPAWSRALIGGMFLKEYCPICPFNQICEHRKELGEIFIQVRDSAYQIIERKGETSYGIGLALARITRAILNDENAVLPVSSLFADYPGGEEVYLSLPAVVNREGVRQVIRLDLAPAEKEALHHSAGVIREVIDQLDLPG